MSQKYEGSTAWTRVLFVALFWIVFYVSQLVIATVVIAQCAFTVITGTPNHQLLKLGDMLGKYVGDIMRYVTFNTDQRPFPFSDFPKSDLVVSQNAS